MMHTRPESSCRPRSRSIAARAAWPCRAELQDLEPRLLLSGVGVSGPLVDINPGLPAGDPLGLVEVYGWVFFAADDGVHGRELWKTDGTEEGTEMVRDIFPGPGSSGPQELTVVGEGMIFFSADDGVHGRELWQTYGTEEGTAKVRDIRPGAAGSEPTELTDFRGVLYFGADDGVHGRELWKSDGTEGGTAMVQDINPAGNSNPAHLTEMNGTLLFSACTPTFGNELWRTDGTATGTWMVKNIRPVCNSSPQWLTNVDGTLFFAADDGTHGFELWKSDGTEGGTVMMRDILPGAGSSYPLFLTNVEGTLFLAADDGAHGYELWKSDGTPGGTGMVADILPGAEGSWPMWLTEKGGDLFFAADDGSRGLELWKSDGTAGGTDIVTDLLPGSDGSNPQFLTNLDGVLLFGARDETHGYELWQSDGTGGGTEMLADVNPSSGDSNPTQMTMVNDRIIFNADDGLTGYELWVLGRSPVAVDDAYWTDEDTLLELGAFDGVLGNDTDPDGDPLTAALVDGPYNGALTLNPDGSFTYTPDDEFSGTDSFTYVANDGEDDSEPATVTIDVYAVNDPPTAADDSGYSTDEEAELVVSAPGVLVNDSDPEGDPLTAVLLAGPANGSVTLYDDGSFSYWPDTDYYGPDSFTYVANDGLADSAPATVFIDVYPVNDPPVAADDYDYSTNEDTPLVVSAPGVLDNDTDAENDALTAVRVDGPYDGTLTLNPDGSFTYMPDKDFFGGDSFTYMANDGLLDSDPVVVTIDVYPVNDAPVANDDYEYSTDEDNELIIIAPGVLGNDTDTENDPLTAVRVDGPYDGTLTLNPDGSFSYMPDLNFFGTDSFTYMANDGLDDSLPATMTIDVYPVNDLPIAYAGPDQVVPDEGEGTATVVLDGSGSTDVEGLVSYVWTIDGTEIATGVNPTVVLFGLDFLIELTVTDTDGATDTDDMMLTISPGQFVGEVPLTAPAMAGQVAAGEKYAIQLDAGGQDAPVRLLGLGPLGWQPLADDLPATGGAYEWDTTSAAPGWYCFATQGGTGGAQSYADSPAWLLVSPSGGQQAAAAPEAIDLTWLSPAGGEAVAQGEAFQIRWQASIPAGQDSQAALWVSHGGQWSLLADGLDLQAGTYVWDTSDTAPGAYRFSLRLNSPLADEWESDWLTVL